MFEKILQNKFFNIVVLLLFTLIDDRFFWNLGINPSILSGLRYIFCLFVMFYFIYYVFIKKNYHLLKKYKYVYIFCLFSGMSLFWAYNISEAVKIFLTVYSLIIYFTIITDSISMKEYINTLYLYGVLITFMNVFAYIFMNNICFIYADNVKAAVKGIVWSRSALVTYMIFSFVMTASTLKDIKKQSKVKVVFKIIVLLINVIVIALSKSSTGIVLIVVSPFLFYLFKKEKVTFRVKTIIYFIISYILIFQRVHGDVFNNIVYLLFKKNFTFSGRIYIWHYAVKLIERRPLLGYGINFYDISFNKFILVPDYREAASHAHNGFLDLTMQLGLIGLILFIIIYWGATKALDNNKGRYEYLILGVGIVLMDIMNLMEPYILSVSTFIVIWSMLICIIAYGDSTERTYKYNKKKVLYINFVDLDNLNTGSAVRPKKIYDAFLNEGYEVEMLTGLHNRKLERWKSAWKYYLKIRKDNYAFCYVEPPSGPFFNLCDHLLLIYIKNKKVPIGLFYRDAYWKFADWYNVKGIKRTVINTMHRFDWIVFNKTCKVIFFPSETMADLFKVNGKKDVLPPGAQKGIYIDKNNYEAKNIIFVGATGKANGTDMLLQALKELNDEGNKVNLTIICRETDEYIEKYKSESWIQINTNVSGVEKLKLFYEKASVAIIPRRVDVYMDFAIPIKLFEYISFGIPIISTKCKEMSKIIEGNGLGIACDDNTESLKEAIKQLFSSDCNYELYKRNLKNFIDENTWEEKVHYIQNQLDK